MNTNICPCCGETMEEFSAILSGGLWLCNSPDYLRRYLEFLAVEGKGELPSNAKTPLHTIVGGRGYRFGTWPKDALRCDKCGTVAILGKCLGVNY
jgi:hypothetical protein